jgi:hypothetical protein
MSDDSSEELHVCRKNRGVLVVMAAASGHILTAPLSAVALDATQLHCYS